MPNKVSEKMRALRLKIEHTYANFKVLEENKYSANKQSPENM